MTIRHSTGATGDGLVDLSLGEIWENVNDLRDMTVLARNHGGTIGRVKNVPYDFAPGFDNTPGGIHITAWKGRPRCGMSP